MSTLFILLFILCTAIQLVFGIFFSRIRKINFEEIGVDQLVGISVIICAKNEYEALQLNLPLILQQKYPKELFEIIVVNDASTDESASLLNEFKITYPQLKTLSIAPQAERKLPGKKWALDYGIQEATFENVLLTDADCHPHSDQWMLEFARCKIHTKKHIILGYGKYEKSKGFLNAFIRWETFHTAIQYFSFAAIGKAYMGVGRNLFYERELYLKAKNNSDFWNKYKKTPSGDDDLLIGHIASSGNTALCFNENAQTISSALGTWKSWWAQKTRHVSTGKLYAKNTQLLLGLYAMSHGLFWFLGISLILISYIYQNFFILKVVLFLFTWRMGIFLHFYYKWQRALKEKELFLFAPLGDIFWSIYNLILSPYIFWKNKNKWK